MIIDASAISDTGRVRPGNEDAVGCFPEQRLFAVADGMGGHAYGEVASRLAIDSLRDAFGASTAPDVPPHDTTSWKSLARWFPPRRQSSSSPTAQDRLCAAVRQANARIRAEGIARAQPGDYNTLGTTVVALHFDTDATGAAYAHVGDSRLYRLRNGELRLLTADHTLYGQPYWGSKEIPLELRHTNQLLEALGTAADVHISSAALTVHHEDLFLLCSDGLSGSLTPVELHRALQAEADLDELGRSLVRLANDAGGRDNISAVLVRAKT